MTRGVRLAETERDALWESIERAHRDPTAYDQVEHAVERTAAARVAEAVDRERAAWATKVEALADDLAGRLSGHLWRPDVVDALRGLLAADDDTEGKP